LRQFDSAFPLAFDDPRIAGINRRRAAKIARAREYGRKFWRPTWGSRRSIKIELQNGCSLIADEKSEKGLRCYNLNVQIFLLLDFLMFLLCVIFVILYFFVCVNSFLTAYNYCARCNCATFLFNYLYETWNFGCNEKLIFVFENCAKFRVRACCRGPYQLFRSRLVFLLFLLPLLSRVGLSRVYF